MSDKMELLSLIAEPEGSAPLISKAATEKLVISH
jgi:hypothetical protein